MKPSHSGAESDGDKPIEQQKKKRRRRTKREMQQARELIKKEVQEHGPFICEECGYPFKRREKLEVHKKRSHLNIRDFKCEHCPMAFFYKHQRDSHVKRVHLKIKDTGTSSNSLHNYLVNSCTLNFKVWHYQLFRSKSLGAGLHYFLIHREEYLIPLL